MATTRPELLGIATPVPMGDWQASVTYQKLNIVRYNGASYIAKKQNQGFQPTVTQGWQEVWQVVAYDGRGVVLTVITYQAGISNTEIPNGEWTTEIPDVPQGQYLWTRTVYHFTDGSETISYSVSLQGLNFTQQDRDNVDRIVEVIPSSASEDNPLTTKDFVNSSINNLAAFYITSNAAGDAFPTRASLLNATTFYQAGKVRVPTQNDYAIVLSDENQPKGVDGSYPTTRYSYQGGTYPNGQWDFQYIVNNTSLTQAQINAINSGITSALVTKLNGIQEGAQKNPTNYVTTDTVQHINAFKYFTAGINLSNGPQGEYGGKISFGDGDYVYITEDADDHLEIHASSGIKLDGEVNVTDELNVDSAITAESISSSGSINASDTIDAAQGVYDGGRRVYSPKNPPPAPAFVLLPLYNISTTVVLRIRDVPSTDGGIIAPIPPSTGIISSDRKNGYLGSGDNLTIITGITDDGAWYEVTYQGQAGYMASQFVIVGDIVDLSEQKLYDHRLNINTTGKVPISNFYFEVITTNPTPYSKSNITQFCNDVLGGASSRVLSTSITQGLNSSRTFGVATIFVEKVSNSTVSATCYMCASSPSATPANAVPLYFSSAALSDMASITDTVESL